MGYAGAVFLVQEVCNALFDALFGILPLARDLDRVDATPSRLPAEVTWEDDARMLLDDLIESQPVLIRISAAKRLRDLAEHETRAAGARSVTRERVDRAYARESGISVG
jgi:chlorophyllide a reductase subunit Z